MSAPDTNIDRQKRRHWPAILGIGFALVAAAIFAVIALTSEGVPDEDQAAGGTSAVETTQ